MGFNNAEFPKNTDQTSPTEQPVTAIISEMVPTKDFQKTTPSAENQTEVSVDQTTMTETLTAITLDTTETSTIVSVGTMIIPEVPLIISVSVAAADLESTITTENVGEKSAETPLVLVPPFTEEYMQNELSEIDLTTRKTGNNADAVTGYVDVSPKISVDLATTIMTSITNSNIEESTNNMTTTLETTPMTITIPLSTRTVLTNTTFLDVVIKTEVFEMKSTSKVQVTRTPETSAITISSDTISPVRTTTETTINSDLMDTPENASSNMRTSLSLTDPVTVSTSILETTICKCEYIIYTNICKNN